MEEQYETQLGEAPKKPALGHPPRYVVEVTKELFEAAKRRSSSHCMFAEALKKADPRLRSVAVDIQTIRATLPEKGERYTWLTPRKCQLAIIEYDDGEPFKPFSFHLRRGQTTRAGTNKPSGKAVMKHPPSDGGKKGGVPNIIGGNPPPNSPVGARREFGLRAFTR